LPIPDEFFWSYLYATSPLANLRLAQERAVPPQTVDLDTVSRYVARVFLPDTFAKRIAPGPTPQYRVTEELTVGTCYYETYPLLGWPGMYTYLVIMAILPFVYTRALRFLAPRYADVGEAVLCTVYTLSMFTNFLNFTPLLLPLAYPFLLSIFSPRLKTPVSAHGSLAGDFAPNQILTANQQ
jgi:hypothetical protein